MVFVPFAYKLGGFVKFATFQTKISQLRKSALILTGLLYHISLSFASVLSKNFFCMCFCPCFRSIPRKWYFLFFAGILEQNQYALEKITASV
jgi:hypothetical protein